MNNNTVIKYTLSKLSSCYRKLKQPQKAIELYQSAKEKYPAECVTAMFLTSVAAAYCNIDNYVDAKDCYNKAVALSKDGYSN